jgi:hypothetical protein
MDVLDIINCPVFLFIKNYVLKNGLPLCHQVKSILSWVQSIELVPLPPDTRNRQTYELGPI